MGTWTCLGCGGNWKYIEFNFKFKFKFMFMFKFKFMFNFMFNFMFDFFRKIVRDEGANRDFAGAEVTFL